MYEYFCSYFYSPLEQAQASCVIYGAILNVDNPDLAFIPPHKIYLGISSSELEEFQYNPSITSTFNLLPKNPKKSSLEEIISLCKIDSYLLLKLDSRYGNSVLFRNLIEKNYLKKLISENI